MTIDGTNGDDILTGTLLTDTINGFDGDDILVGGGGADILNGGAGNDTFRFSIWDLDVGEVINGGSGIDRLQIDGWLVSDFRSVSLSSIEVLEIARPNDGYYYFNSSQIGSGLSSTATIDGLGVPVHLRFYVDTQSVDLSNLNFQQWNEVRSDISILSSVSGLAGSTSGVSITGSHMGDNITGSDGNDILRGGVGNDNIRGAIGADSLYGGTGNDSFRYLFTEAIASGEVIDGGTGIDKIVISGWADGIEIENENEIDFDFRATTLRSIEEIEFSYYFDKNAIINSSQLGSGLNAYATITAENFNGAYFHPATVNEFHVYVDTASTSLSGLTFQNWMANDRVVVFGTRDADDVSGSSVGDTIYGYRGNDVLRGLSGDDQLFGGGGNDTISATNGTNILVGGRGNDVVNGGSGADTLFGNIGNDQLDGGWGQDVIYAGGLSDTAFGGRGDDTIHGNWGNDRLFGEAGNDTIIGGHGVDTIDGGDGNDQIHGNGFADELHGGDGDDSIYGGAGSDIINGGADNDMLWGGASAADDGVTDRFVFESSFGEDRIRDFENGLDTIDFSGNATFNGFATVSANATQSGSDILITQDAGNTLTIDDMNLADLDASDFIF